MRFTQSILQRVAYVILPEILCILQSVWLLTVNQGGTADKEVYSSLTEKEFCRGFFVFCRTIHHPKEEK